MSVYVIDFAGEPDEFSEPRLYRPRWGLLHRLWLCAADRRGQACAGFPDRSSFLIPNGFRVFWTVLETTTKHFVIRDYAQG